MKERLFDIIKWGIIIIIAGIVFYFVCPKYYFVGATVRGNKVTGRVEKFEETEGEWKNIESSSFGERMLRKYGGKRK